MKMVLHKKTALNSLVSNTENRGDAIIVMDLVNYNATVTNVIRYSS
jgi:hypothetical protein